MPQTTIRTAAPRTLLSAIAAIALLAAATSPAVASELGYTSIVPVPTETVRAVLTPANEAVPVDWKMLGSLDYMSGKMPANLKALDGKLVKVPGFIVPLDDYDEEGAEFLLVPYFGACVHVPPPPPNQMVFVRMQGGRKIKFGWWDPVWMEGTLKIEHFESPYGAAGFQITGTRVTPYKAD